jgi:heterodisulfide reductase subunit C
MPELLVTKDAVRSDFARKILEESGTNVNLCFQCKKCTVGCPIAYEMDVPPTRIIHAVRLGLKDLVLNSKTIWLCASCETCTTRCPQDVDIAKVMDAARIIARREGVEPKEPDIPAFARTMVRNIWWHGRTFELGMIGRLKLATGQFMKDTGLGMKMLWHGKLAMIPSFKDFFGVKGMMARIKKKEAAKAETKGK